MDPQNNIKQLQDLFTQARDILIITKDQPSIDGLASSLALYHLLSGMRDLQGKNKRVVIAAPGRQGTQYSLLPGHDKIVSELGLRDFVIGINGFVEGAIENVNWYADKGRMNVVFKSNPAVPMQFDLKNLDPFYAGANFDVVMVIDAAAPTDLGNAYRQDPGMYTELPVVNISRDPQNTRFGRVNIVDSQVGSVSELVYQLTQILRLPLTSEVAGLFMLGIAAGTGNFQNKGSQTDAVVAKLQQFSPRPFDLASVQAQASLPLLPVHKNPPAPTVAPAPVPAAQPTAQVAPAPYQPPVQPTYPVQDQYAPQYQYPAQPEPQQAYDQQTYQQYQEPVAYPEYQPQEQYQYPDQQAESQNYDQYAPSEQPVDEAVAISEETELYGEPVVEEIAAQAQEYEVPSISHDYAHQDTYIPTADFVGDDHVEPAIAMPYVQHGVTNPDPNIEEQKEQYAAPDWNAPPKIFGGTDKSRG